jgi:hypothetical protein
MANPTNNRASRPAAPLIQHNTLDQQGEGVVRWMVAAFISIFLNGGVLLALAVLLPGPSAGAAATEQAVKAGNEAEVQPAEPPPPEASDPLTVTDIDPAAIAPDLEINYNVDRKAEVSVPGVVNPDEPVGIENGDKSAPPISLPLPFGTGGGTGAAMSSDVLGSGPSIGSVGGYSLRGMPLAGSFYGRSGATRKKALEEGGGTKESEATVAAGLTWLLRVQSPDGRWMLDGNFKNKGQANDIAGTAFGLLPFLGAGYTHKSKGKQNPYDKPIEKAILFLLRRQDRKTGNFGGGMYGHCLATIALSEVYGLTQDPALRRPTQLAVNYIVAAQHPEGGWRYSPGERGDTSVSGWAIMALKSAKMGGLIVPEITFRKAIRYLDGVCDRSNEGYGYTGPGSTPTMSAVGLLCRQYLQAWGPNNPRLIKGIKMNLKPYMPPMPPTKPTSPGMYYFYYATQVMHHFGGDEWKKWNERMRDSLIKSRDQSSNPLLKGSWDPTGDPHAAVGGRLMYTSLALLTLEVYYRHLPLYYREAGERREKLLAGS